MKRKRGGKNEERKQTKEEEEEEEDSWHFLARIRSLYLLCICTRIRDSRAVWRSSVNVEANQFFFASERGEPLFSNPSRLDFGRRIRSSERRSLLFFLFLFFFFIFHFFFFWYSSFAVVRAIDAFVKRLLNFTQNYFWTMFCGHGEIGSGHERVYHSGGGA